MPAAGSVAEVSKDYCWSNRRTQLLRAQALLELGDPRALAEADAYCTGADHLGDPLSRWQSLSQRAATALLTGRLDDAATVLAGFTAHQAWGLGSPPATTYGSPPSPPKQLPAAATTN